LHFINDENSDDRSAALAAAKHLVAIADQFENADAARRILRNAAVRLKRKYAFSREQQKRLILVAVSEGFQRYDELAAEFDYFSDHELRGLISELEADGLISEKRVAPSGDKGGRPYRLYSINRGFSDANQNPRRDRVA